MQTNSLPTSVIEQKTQDPDIEQHYASIIEFKKNEMKINFVLSLESTEEEEKQQLLQLKDNIETALKQQLAALKEKEKKHGLYPLSLELLTTSDKGKLTKCFMREERKWKNAEVLEVDVEEQVAQIKRYEHEQVEAFPAFYLKVLKDPEPDMFTEGTHCKAIYSEDGEFYPCVIEKVEGQDYHVRYKKYQTVEVVKIHRLRLIQNSSQRPDEIKFQNLNEFKVPQKLKIQPNDPENVKKSKKKKIKALKFSFKNAQVEEVNQEKKQKWKNFNLNASKTGHFKTKYDLELFNSKKKM